VLSFNNNNKILFKMTYLDLLDAIRKLPFVYAASAAPLSSVLKVLSMHITFY